MGFSLNRRFFGLIAAAAVVYVFATNSEVVWLYVVSALVGGMVVVGIAGPVISLRRLRLEYRGLVRRGFSPPLAADRGRVFAGDVVALRFHYKGDAGRVRLGPAGLVGGLEWALDTTGSTAGEILLEGDAGPRGELELTLLRVASSWPLGIATASRSLPLALRLVVNPLYFIPPRAAREGISWGLQETQRRGPGIEFIGLRDYRPGDSRRQIHWPSTARRGQLVVVETATESEQPARYSLELLQGATADGVELAVSIVASLAAGRAAHMKPFSVEVRGQGPRLERWSDILTTLSRATPRPFPGDARGRVVGDWTHVTAEGSRVIVEGPDIELTLPGSMPLAEARDMLGESV